MVYTKHRSIHWKRSRAFYVLASLLVLLNACGGKEAPEGDTLPGTSDRPAAPKSLIMEGIPEGAPETYAPLRFLPANAQVAVAFPAVPRIEARILPVAQALAPEEKPELALDEAARDIGEEWGMTVDSYEGLAEELGVEADAPMAVFLDFAPTLNGKVAPENGVPGDDGGSDLEGATPAETAPGYVDSEDPAWAAVFVVRDDAQFRTAVQRIVENDESLAGLPQSTLMEGGVELTVCGDYAYFLTEAHAVVGALPLVKGAAQRVVDPASFRYGTPACPVVAEEEIVALVYGNRFMALMDQAVPLMAEDLDDAAVPAIQASLDEYRDMFAGGPHEDPAVMTLSFEDNAVQMLARIDTKANPGLIKAYGEATPLRLARYLPETTMALISLRFNEVFKEQLMKNMLPAAQASGAGDAAIAGQIIPQIGDELTIGVTEATGGFPGAFAMLGLAQPEVTKSVLQMFVPMEAGFEHGGVNVGSVSLPVPVPLYLGFLDDFALAGTNEAELKGIIDRYKAKEDSPLFASMDPPLDLTVPRYQAIAISPGPLYATAAATAAAFGGDLGDAGPVLERVSRVVRELRSLSEMEDGWMKGRVTLYLNDRSAVGAPQAIASDPPPGE